MTEKRKPHYDLIDLQREIVELGHRAFTRSALDGGRRLGLRTHEMLRIIARLVSSDFHKSMTKTHDPRTWQDVYWAQTASGLEIYIKIAAPNAEFPRCIISFKENTRQ